MAKRENTSESHESSIFELPNMTTPESPPFRLLALPPEIRSIIWRLVFETDIIYIHYGSPPYATSLPASPMPGFCTTYHQAEIRRPYFPISAPCGPGPLSWLRTNRQIHEEAKPLIKGRLTFHVCWSQVLSSLLATQMKHILSLSTCRTLSLCLSITIESDFSDGYKFSRFDNVHGWKGYHGNNRDPESLAAGKNEARNLLPVLRELELHLSFTCRQGQGPRLGQLYRVKNPPALVCVDSRRRVEDFINKFCGMRPLGVLRTAKLEDVRVRVQTRGIDHWTDPFPDDRCWCIDRSMDEESLGKIRLGEKIERRLLELSKVECGS